jgi:DNA-binding LytR/AlgR family response regulator
VQGKLRIKKRQLGSEFRQLGNIQLVCTRFVQTRLVQARKETYNWNMKITINTDERFTETEITVNCNRISDDIEKLLAAIQILDMRLLGRKGGRQYTLDATDILYIESADKRSFLYTSTDVYESSLRLYELEEKFAGGDFLRASKNCIFNINYVQSIEPDLDRRLILTMEKDFKIIVSRQYAAIVKQKLEA